MYRLATWISEKEYTCVETDQELLIKKNFLSILPTWVLNHELFGLGKTWTWQNTVTMGGRSHLIIIT